MSWALDLVRDLSAGGFDPDTGAGSLGVEFVTTSITSPSLSADIGELAAEVALAAAHVKYAQLYKRGYIVLDVDTERVQAAWYLFDRGAPDDPTSPTFDAAMPVLNGTPFFVPDTRAAEPRSDPPALAPRS
jgi:alkaline phosphatase D